MGVKTLGTVKVLGSGCPRCQETKKLVVNALIELQLAADVQEIKDLKEIAKLGILFTPAIIINNEIVSQGEIPKYKEVKKWLMDRAPR
ncbi:MAG: thioredoxin family protein [Nitrososphaerales archaeon]|nr:thioredoxin family protein [Nitrososphaerales archaeon]